MIIKCKMCGGDLAFMPGATYGTCEFCGSTSTIPQADDEGKLNRYNRANHFRRQGEFDKAVTAYEKLLEQDDADAEAHWGAVISRYGIEYVEDPATGKRIPTCHRVQVASILADADYLAAVEHAPDSSSRDLYKQQAAEIAEIQKGILAISATEKPYDVFICYKETDEQGQRTRDSQWAQDVYYGLTEQGYKVFFSRITLEDKLGQQYEPYIFAALNSAKVMVVIGSKPEYFNAVWVKNEWSRYLALMAKDRKRLLIPCYRGMDPYDLPEELSSLQSQDMSKIGFMQDLLRGIRKVLEADNRPEQTPVIPHLEQQTAPLLRRVFMSLEDGNWESADQHCEKVLDLDPENGRAYLGKLMAKLEVCTEDDLLSLDDPFDDDPWYKKAIRYGDDALRKMLEEANDAIRLSIRRAEQQEFFDAAVSMLEDAYSVDMCRKARAEFEALGDFDGVSDMLAKCDARIAEIQESQYEEAASLMKNAGQSSMQWARVCRVLDSDDLDGYKDVPALRKHAKQREKECIAAEKEAEEEAYRFKLYTVATQAMEAANESGHGWVDVVDKLAAPALTNYRDVAQLRALAAKRLEECFAAQQVERQKEIDRINRTAAIKRRLIVLGILTAVIAITGYLVMTQVIIPRNKYSTAVQLRADGKYNQAVALFQELGNYRDAATQVSATYYAEGEARRSVMYWQAAITAFQNAGRYSDAPTQVSATYYAEGVSKRNLKDWAGAVEAFTNAGNYSDAETQIAATYYAQGEAKRSAQDWAGAAAAYKNAGSYSDAPTQYIAACYAEGEAKRNAKDWAGAVTAFKNAGNYSDAATQVSATYYAEGEAKRGAKDWAGAVTAFKNAGNYSDAATQVSATYYAEGEAKRDAQDWAGAETAFKNAGSFGDASTQITETKYQHAQALNAKKDYAGAVAIFTAIRGHKDVDNLLVNDPNLAAAVAAAAREPFTKVGNIVTYGHYEQDNHPLNGKEAIEWIVLKYDSKSGKSLLISRYGLDAHQFCSTPSHYPGWDKSEIRSWLNSTFLNNAFTAKEQEGIVVTKVSTPSSARASVRSDTLDKLWLLSKDEATTYFKNDEARKTVSTKYAQARGASLFTGKYFSTSDGTGFCWWWLRSPDGDYGMSASNVDNFGSFSYNHVQTAYISVRPVFWINLESADIN